MGRKRKIKKISTLSNKYFDNVDKLEHSSPEQKSLGIPRRIQDLDLINKITDLTQSIFSESGEGDLNQKIKALEAILKVRGVLSRDPAYLIELISKMSEQEKTLLSSYLETHKLKKGFVKKELGNIFE